MDAEGTEEININKNTEAEDFDFEIEEARYEDEREVVSNATA